jgi:hypothetical protein
LSGGVWNGSTIEIPVMGSDPTSYTDGYLESGEIPNFRILDTSTGAVYDAVLNSVQGAFGDCSGYPESTCNTFPAFSDFGTYWDLGTVDAIQDCNAQIGGHAYIDDCSDCSGGSTGLGHNHNDPDNDAVCNDGAANGEADNCPDTNNTDQWNYDNDAYGDACDTDDDNDGSLDDDDSTDFDPFLCSDTDGDECEDCSSGSYDTANDGLDYDSDTTCDDTDPSLSSSGSVSSQVVSLS